MFTLQKHNSVRHFHLRRSSNIPARIPVFWGSGRFARLGQTSFCCNMCEFISFMWALILLISLPILVRLTELRARNIIQISTVGPGRQRQHQTLHRDTRCDTFSLTWGTRAWPEVPVDKSMCLSCSMSQSILLTWPLVWLTWQCEDGAYERCNRFKGPSRNSYYFVLT